MKNMKLRLALPLLILVAFILAGVLFTTNFLDGQKDSGIVINLAGKQRMLSQKMTKEALSILNSNSNHSTLLETANLFKKTLSGLQFGNAELNLPPTTNKKIILQLQKVEKLWKPFFESSKIIANSNSDSASIHNATAYLQMHNMELLKEMNNAVKMFEEENTAKVSDLKTQMYLILIIASLIAIVSFIVTNMNLLKPMSIVIDSAKEIATKDLSYERDGNKNLIAKIKNNDLFQELANSINSILLKIQKQSEMLNNLPTPVLAMDKEFNVTFINRLGAEMLGEDQAALTGQKCYDLMKTKDCKTKNCACFQAIEQEKQVGKETIASPLGKEMPIFYQGRPLRDENRNVIGAVEFINDLSQIKEKENYLYQSTQTILNEMDKVGKGNLTINLQPEGINDTVDSLYISINNTISNIKQMVLKVSESVNNTISVSTQIATSIEEFSSGSREQQKQTQNISEAIDEMSKTISQTSQNTTMVAESAKKSEQFANDGKSVVLETVKAMDVIAGIVSGAADKVSELGENSDRIGEIVSVINEIADQTNLLALNAAIEAARAGEHGRGFAVVADEVKKLAERTTVATNEIANMIEQIQLDTKNVVDSINSGNDEVQNGKKLAENTGQAINTISEATNSVVDEITQVAAASEEQNQTSEQIVSNIIMIDNTLTETNEGLSFLSSSANDLNKTTEILKNLVDQFKIDTTRTDNKTRINNKKYSTEYS